MQPFCPFPMALAFTASLPLRKAFCGTEARSPFPVPIPRSSGSGPPAHHKHPPEPGCPGWSTGQAGSASSQRLLRVLAPVPRGQHGERAGQVPSVLRSLPGPHPPGGLHYEGDGAGTSICGLGRTGPPGVRGRASLECLQSSPRLSAAPPHVPSCQGRAGQERSSGPSASTSCALGQRPGSLHE